MVAVDTNVLIRLVTNDHAAQAARAEAVFRSGPVFIAKTVLLEAEWVLRQVYGLGTEAILKALRGVLGLANVTVEDPATVVTAMRLLEKGIDFADALHVASSVQAGSFVTFDQRLVKHARGTMPIEVSFA